MGGYGFVPGGTANLADIITGFGRERGLAESAQAQPDLIRAETQQATARADQERQQAILLKQQVADSEILKRVYAGIDKDADARTMMNQTRSAAIRLGMSAPGVMALDKHHADLIKEQAAMAKEQQALTAAQHKEAGDILMGVRAVPPEQRPQAWAVAARRLSELEPDAGFSEQYPGDPSFEALIGGHALSGAILGQRKEEQGIATSKAQEGQAGAATAEAGARTAQVQQQTKEQKRVADVGRLSAAAGSRLGYTTELARLKREDPELAALAPADSDVFDASGTPDAAAVKRIRQLGMSPTQLAQEHAAEITAEATKRRDEENARHNKALESRQGSDLTTDQKNFQQAKSEGFKGDFLSWMRERNPRATTGKERTDLGFYNRAKEANETITTSGLEDRVAKAGLIEQGRMSLPNALQGKEQQAYLQAQRAFTEARLRKESGAAIPEPEYENDRRTYFAKFGDSPETIDQKRKARATVLEGLKFASGKAYEEFYGEPNVPAGRAATPAVAAIPDPVKSLLSGSGPGIYTLSDGSVWVKGADGSIKAK